ncbi:hypothetical protein IR009_02885 [Pseudomonas putida]|uniref:hypothetical protein n=1 Tax=Pseudomonas putida TaxID=303 RepID=UPI0018AAC7A2|nr:hypothetical protein [Pseudomonas putida]MBF8764166.1 hypothetical protein [Pseudomonas putida]
MSNAEKMVSEDLIRAILGNAAQGYFSKDHGDQLRAILAQPAQQHQGEPVALPARKDPTQHWVEPGGVHKAEGWNSYHDEIAKLGPLYTRPAPANIAEVEREPECFCVEHGLHIETLRAHLAEAHGLLRLIAEQPMLNGIHRARIKTLLSASPEPQVKS